MRYVLKERLFDLGDDYAIRDESGREVYRVDGKVFTIGDKLVLEDRDGNALATIRKKLISFRPAYEIHRDGRHAATVTKALFSPFRCKFSVDVPGPGDLEARGLASEKTQRTPRTPRTAGTNKDKFVRP